MPSQTLTKLANTLLPCGLLMLLMFAVAGSPPPAINEAHYLLKAKQVWQPDWMTHDAFISSGKAHLTFYLAFGWLLRWFDFPTVAWLGRIVGWGLLALGLTRLSQALSSRHDTADHSVRSWSATLWILPAAAIWITGMEHANLAGEWVVGGIEAKVLAYGFLLLGLAAITTGNWARGWIWFGCASAFHVLVGGWAVVGAMLARVFLLWQTSPRKHALASQDNTPSSPTVSGWSWHETVCLICGGMIALAGLIPALRLSLGLPPEDVTMAARNYAYGRLGHHLTPSMFPWYWFARHGVLLLGTVLATLALLRRLPPDLQPRYRRLFACLAAGPLLAGVGLLVGLLPAIAPDLAARLLRYYWFRMTDAYVPLAAGITTMAWLVHIPAQTSAQSNPQSDAGSPITLPSRFWKFFATSVLVLSLATLTRDAWMQSERGLPEGFATAHDVIVDGQKTTPQERQQVIQDWLQTCDFIRENTPPDAIFLTPRAQQTFKWYAQRSEVVNWKDVPQDVPSLLDWGRRINRVYPVRLKRRHPPGDPTELRELRRAYDAEFLIVDRRVMPDPVGLRRLYPPGPNSNNATRQSTYAVFVLPEPNTAAPQGANGQ